MKVPIKGYTSPFMQKMQVNESNLQCKIYHIAQLEKLNLAAEIRLPSDFHRSGSLRADLVLLYKQHVIAVVEVKRSYSQNEKWFGKLPEKKTRQYKAYKALRKKYGIRVFYVNYQTDLIRLMKRLKRVRKKFIQDRAKS